MINGICFKNAVISGYNNIANSKKSINELNIFPVPDGDTGTNMSMTIGVAAKDIPDAMSVSEISQAVASSMLKGARGNSGVILSIIFGGIARGLEGLEEAGGKDIAKALGIGVSQAYEAISNPTEGTILTVVRVAYEEGLKASEINDDPVFVWSSVCDGAKKALANTPYLLPVLKKAGVVDAGGKGLVLIFEGMLSVLKNGVTIELNTDAEISPSTMSLDEFRSMTDKFDEEVNYTYCTEFVVKKDDKEKDKKGLQVFLESIGDCVLVVSDDEIIKVHVHTDNPGLALQYGLKYGQLLTVKIENMREQNRKIIEASDIQDGSSNQKFEFAEPTEEYGFVCVSAGDGLRDIFVDLGCTHVVSGGQTMNPSTQELLSAINATPAKTVYVLPNNRNILLSAKQAVSEVTDRNVVVIETKTIPQGISAMLAFQPGLSVEENITAMHVAASEVSTGQVTFAARDSSFNGLKIKKGDIIALDNEILTLSEKDPVKAVYRLARGMITKTTSCVTLIYGKDISKEQAEKAEKLIKSKLGLDVDVTVVYGGQPVYYFILSVE